MAPTVTAAMTNSQEYLNLTIKLRKPLMGKLHREQTNSSMEQLKSPEFLKPQPDFKVKKADTLEMTVCVLRQLQQQHRRLMKQFNKLQSSFHENLTEVYLCPLSSTVQASITKNKSPVNSVLERMW